MNIRLALAKVMLLASVILACDFTIVDLEGLFDELCAYGRNRIVEICGDDSGSNPITTEIPNPDVVSTVPRESVSDILFELYAFLPEMKALLPELLLRKDLQYKKYVIAALMEVYANSMVSLILKHMPKKDIIDPVSNFYIAYMISQRHPLSDPTQEALCLTIGNSFGKIYNDLRVILIDVKKNEMLCDLEKLGDMMVNITKEDMNLLMCDDIMFFVDYLLSDPEGKYVPVFRQHKITNAEIEIAIKNDYGQVLKYMGNIFYDYVYTRIQDGGFQTNLIPAIQAIYYLVFNQTKLDIIKSLVPENVNKFLEARPGPNEQTKAFLMEHGDCLKNQNIILGLLSEENIENGIMAILNDVHRHFYKDPLVLPTETSNLVMREFCNPLYEEQMRTSGVKFTLSTTQAIKYRNVLNKYCDEDNIILDLKDPRIIEIVFINYKGLFGKIYADATLDHRDKINRLFMQPEYSTKREYCDYLLENNYMDCLNRLVEKGLLD